MPYILSTMILRFALRRLATFPFILLFVNFIGFAFAFYFEPVVSSNNPYASGEFVLPPLFPEYWSYLSGFAELDFGKTFNGEPVLSAITRFSINSFGLVALALTFSIVLGIFLGRLAVWRESTKVATWLTILASIGLASPGFYIAVLLISFFLLLTIYGPGVVIPFQGFGWDSHLILPVLVLMIQPTVKIAQVTGATLIEELQKPYVKAAIGLGHSFVNMKKRFAFRNALVPILQSIAYSARLMIAELIVIERLFNWPGLGKFIGSVLQPTSASGAVVMTPSTMAALLTVLTLAFLLIDFITLLTARIVDPRLRQEVHADNA